LVGEFLPRCGHAAARLSPLRRWRSSFSAIAEDRTALHWGTRSRPVPLDPLTSEALNVCLQQRTVVTPINPYVLVHHPRARAKPCSAEILGGNETVPGGVQHQTS